MQNVSSVFCLTKCKFPVCHVDRGGNGGSFKSVTNLTPADGTMNRGYLNGETD